MESIKNKVEWPYNSPIAYTSITNSCFPGMQK